MNLTKTFKNSRKCLIFSAALSGLLLASGVSKACGVDAYLGQVCTFAFDYCPDGFVEANGQLLPVTQYNALYALLGNRFGGSSGTNFGVPDLRGRSVVGRGLTTPGTKTVALAEKYGNESTTLAAANIPPIQPNATLKVSSNTTGNALIPSATNKYLAGSASGAATAAAIWSSNLGSAPVDVPLTMAAMGSPTPAAVNILPPRLGLTQCISTIGIWPSRP